VSARINPRTEAGALIAEWVDVYLRTDPAWREVYSADEAAAIEREIRVRLKRLPEPSESLFHRQRTTAT
jgi:hypothetical protein